MEDYGMVIIDPQLIGHEGIKILQQDSTFAYAYMDIASSHTSNPNQPFEAGTISYDPQRRVMWMNVGDPLWVHSVLLKAKTYSDMGVDGFFIDGCDEYTTKPYDVIFNNLVSLIKEISGYGKPVIIHNGDVFVKKLLESKENATLIHGICQDCVFTNQQYGMNRESDTAYYQDYLRTCSSKGLSVYMVEYGIPQNTINAFAGSHGYHLFYTTPTQLN